MLEMPALDRGSVFSSPFSHTKIKFIEEIQLILNDNLLHMYIFYKGFEFMKLVLSSLMLSQGKIYWRD